ncbi:pilus assembly protein CpaC [Marinobacter pelagius]|uniref:Pilus assembly protein CpaC n=1 Tax=Marinobacter pelagius TaxID=379482 RepID=A0A366GDZ2_9GAMM|nr:pilus assembly protein N-terminal domain-containing protein [Marinobacter pelagius]RBP25057.1 pilus assembly protein CpaC [Marinobacter pelagius]
MFSDSLAVRVLRNGVLRVLALLLAQAASAKPVAPEINLAPGEQEVIALSGAVEKVAISDPAVATVVVSGENELLLNAESPGNAVLNIWLEGDSKARVSNVLVSSTAGERPSFSMQVQTDIRVVEVNRSKLNTLGLYYAKLFNGGKTSVGLGPPGSGGFRGIGNPTSPMGGIASDGFNFFRFGSSSLSIINALESGGFAYTLAEPSLVSLSGQSATFLSGGEFPIPVQSDSDGIQIEFKEFGVRLEVSPTVIDQSQIILKVSPEVSELDFTSGVSTGGVAVPGLRIRRTETTVSMAPGESFIISGLVSKATMNNSDRLPGLGNIPVIGALFRSDRVSSENRELIMVVTPHLVTPSTNMDPEVRRLGMEYENSSESWPDMAVGAQKAGEPVEHGLSW